MQVQGERRLFVEIAVGDPGLGIPTVLGTKLGIDDDGEAVRRAVEEGVSSVDEPHRGFGLYWIAEAILSGGSRSMVIHSGNGQLVRYGDGTIHWGSIKSRLPGTIVSIAMPI